MFDKIFEFVNNENGNENGNTPNKSSSSSSFFGFSEIERYLIS